MLDSFKKVCPANPRILVHCNSCGKTTIHGVEIEFEAKWDEGDGSGFFGGSDHRILKCGGCDSVKYAVATWDTEDRFQDENGETHFSRTSKVFPAPRTRALSFDYMSIIPHRLYKILDEVLDAQSNNGLILTTVGLRILVESTCIAAKISGRDLSKKIDNLHSKGLIDEDEKELLHKVRTYGNKGAHEGKSMNADQIASAIAVSFHVIDQLFVLPYKKKKLISSAKLKLE